MEQPSGSQEQPRQFICQGKPTWFSIDESALRLRNSPDLGSISIEIPSCHILSASTVEQSRRKDKRWSLKVDFIKSNGEKSLKKSSVELLGQKEDCQTVTSDINGLVQSLPNRKKSLLVIVNPVSGRKKGLKTCNKILPLFELANIKTELVVTKKKGDATELLKHKDLDTIDGVVLVGGDGTYYEVLNGLLFRAQTDANYDLDCPDREWKPSPLPVGIIPCGTGNGIASELVSRDPVTAALAVIIGKQMPMTTYAIHDSSGKFLTFGGLLIGYGFYGDVIYKAENRRNLGIMRYGVYMLWGLFNIRRFEVDIEYEVLTGALIVPNEDGASTMSKGGGDLTVPKVGGASSVQTEGGASTVQKGGGDSASDVDIGSKPENTSDPSPNKDSVQSEVNAEVTAQEGAESKLEVKSEDLMSSESEAGDRNRELAAVVSKSGDDDDDDDDDDKDVQSEVLADGTVTDGATTTSVATAGQSEGSKEWKTMTGTYFSFGTFLHYDMNEPKTEAVDIFLCNTLADMKNMFKRILTFSKEYSGPMFKTRCLSLKVPTANGNIEMEMALNCDGDYIILEPPIHIQICFHIGLMKLFCC